MTLHVLNSNSSGNCYLLEADNGETLILELGVHWKKIQQALGFNYRKVAGAVVTHSHLDHCKSVKDAILCGINIYGTEKEFEAMPLNDYHLSASHHRLKSIETKQAYHIGPFMIMAFEIEHDTPAPVGYIINHKECGNVLFLTDTFYTRSRFSNLHNILIECNYSEEIITRKKADGSLPTFLHDRIFTSHMALNTTKEVLKANDLTNVQNIVLIHLSDTNSDSALFQREITGLTGKCVQVAKPGLKIPFNKTPF